MSAGEVAVQIGRALWITQLHEAAVRAMYVVFEMLGIPFTAEFSRQIDDILKPLMKEIR